MKKNDNSAACTQYYNSLRACPLFGVVNATMKNK